MTFSGGSTYTPGITQDVTITLTDPAFHAYGYQTSARIQGQEISAVAAISIRSGSGYAALCASKPRRPRLDRRWRIPDRHHR